MTQLEKIEVVSKIVGGVLKHYREEAGYTLQSYAEHVNIPITYVAFIEDGNDTLLGAYPNLSPEVKRYFKGVKDTIAENNPGKEIGLKELYDMAFKKAEEAGEKR